MAGAARLGLRHTIVEKWEGSLGRGVSSLSRCAVVTGPLRDKDDTHAANAKQLRDAVSGVGMQWGSRSPSKFSTLRNETPDALYVIIDHWTCVIDTSGSS